MTATTDAPALPITTPWGHPDRVQRLSDGVAYFETPSHGGFWLNPVHERARKSRFPGFRTFAGGPWYEQDQDAVIVALTFPELFSADPIRNAVRAVRAFANKPEHKIAVRGWRCVIEWLDSDDPQAIDIRRIAAERDAETVDLWDRGAVWTATKGHYPAGTWGVSFSRGRDNATRTVYMEYPERRYYSGSELDSLVVEPLRLATG